ncbi:hypothetical protein QUA43_30400 [Microcoleus sp. N9_B4]|uniref:hypothetical protein n=1 Tax=Microcoleus sp. N9_B4 TaxID=3055386 RepID=UPI002FD08E8A
MTETDPIEKPITAQITWNIAIALIRCIQFTARYGEDEDDQIAKAVCFAQKMQNLLDINSEEYKELNQGWNPEADILVSKATEEEPLQRNLESEGFELDT